MKTFTFTALLFFCFLTHAFSQPKQCYAYDYWKSEKRVWTYLFKGDNFEYLSDDLNGHEVFNTKQELIHKGTFIPIPVLRFELSQLPEQGETLQLNSLFTADYSIFTGFLMNQEQLANVLISSLSLQNPRSKRIGGMGTTDSATAIRIYSLFKDKKVCFFYDVPRFRYAYFENNKYVYYDLEKREMVTLSPSDYVADYKRYFNIK
jgi:hypothetical protein